MSARLSRDERKLLAWALTANHEEWDYFSDWARLYYSNVMTSAGALDFNERAILILKWIGQKRSTTSRASKRTSRLKRS